MIKENKKLYHISKIPNIKLLEPRISTHRKAYVYATESLELGLLFGNHGQGDLDGICGIYEGIPYFYEAYKGALKSRYKGKECYIYEVKPDTFVEGRTSFDGELTSDVPVEVLNCTKVDDIYDYLQKLHNQRKINLVEYNENPRYVNMINRHIENRIAKFGYLNEKEPNYDFCQKHFPNIMKKLLSKNASKDSIS